MRKTESSTKLNRIQQACRIVLKQNALKMGDFREIAATVLGAGGRAFKAPRPDQLSFPFSWLYAGNGLYANNGGNPTPNCFTLGRNLPCRPQGFSDNARGESPSPR